MTVEDEIGSESVNAIREGTERDVIGKGVEVLVGLDYHTIFGGRVLTDR